MSWNPLPGEGAALPKESVYSFGYRGFGYNASMTEEETPSTQVVG